MTEMDDGTAEAPCGVCARHHDQVLPVAWSPAFGQHLCSVCLRRITDAELAATEKANAAARFERHFTRPAQLRWRPGIRG